MKILLVHPGASMSTADVYTGMHAALLRRGHTVWEYALDARIERSGAWLIHCWRKGGKLLPQPTSADILYHCGEGLVTRALRVMPDVVLVVSGMYLHPDTLVLMQRAGLRAAVLYTESPYDDEKQKRLMPYVDVAWTNERLSAVNGVRYLPHAWNAEVHSPSVPVPADVPSHQVVFVGTDFQERIDLLTATDWTGIDLALYGSWDQLSDTSPLRRYIKGGYITNAEAAQLYRKADVGLNLYRTSIGFGPDAPRIELGEAESLNPRAYELAATGCFTVSDERAEVAEKFGDLVPTFRDAADLRRVLDRWLADPHGRARVRKALPAAVQHDTWDRRAIQIEQDLQGAGIGASRAKTPRQADAELQPVRALAGG